jgi:hypothetical protein
VELVKSFLPLSFGFGVRTEMNALVFIGLFAIVVVMILAQIKSRMGLEFLRMNI